MLYAAKMLNMFLTKNKDMKRVEVRVNKIVMCQQEQSGYWGIMKKYEFFSSLGKYDFSSYMNVCTSKNIEIIYSFKNITSPYLAQKLFKIPLKILTSPLDWFSL